MAGATARQPSSASRLATSQMWVVTPNASWTTTTAPLGRASGIASNAGMAPSSVSIVISVVVAIKVSVVADQMARNSRCCLEPHGADVEEERDPVPLLVGIRVAGLPQPLDHEPDVGQRVDVV